MTAPARANTAVARVEPPAPSMVERAKTKELAPFVTDQARALIEPLLRPGDTFDRVLSEIWLAIRKNPELEECTGDSLLLSAARILSWGLVIGEGAFLCPFNAKIKGTNKYEKRCQPIRGYQGLIQLIVNAGGARSIQPFCVYQNEIDQGRFDYVEGSSPKLVHRQILFKSQRGPLVGAYARAIIDRVSPPLIKWMDVEEIDAIRMKSSKSWKTKWVEGQNGRREVPLPLEEIEWYALKTPVLQIGKFLSKGPKMAGVAALLEREEREEMDGEADDLALDPSLQIAAAPRVVEERLADSLIATSDQKAQIARLLDQADLADDRREAIAIEAGKRDVTGARAAEIIAGLERLLPKGEGLFSE